MESSIEQPRAVPPEETKLTTGCAHYKRKSKFVTPCCNKVYTCRFCHDENEDHTVNRKEVTELVCTRCTIRQPVQAACQYCGIRFGKYTCLECNLFDDEDKNQYHCSGCGICRIGGADRFFHCAKCNMCLPIQLKNGHRCVENVSRANCPVCLEDIHTSRIPCHIPDCGHLLHKTCFEQLLNAGHYACPICQTSLLDMSQLWKYLDLEVNMTPMPAEYRNYKVEILCKDCHKESTIKFHVVGLKCLHCGSYNTCRIKGCAQTAMNDEAVGGVDVNVEVDVPDDGGGGSIRTGPGEEEEEEEEAAGDESSEDEAAARPRSNRPDRDDGRQEVMPEMVTSAPPIITSSSSSSSPSPQNIAGMPASSDEMRNNIVDSDVMNAAGPDTGQSPAPRI